MLLFLPQLPQQFVIPFAIGIFAAVLIGMTVHEFAHNYVGYLMGDPVPAREGRLTLNPSVHINWVGFAMFVIIGFGILGQAPISPYRMRNPRWGYLAAVAAGPFSNLLVAVVFAIIYAIVPLSPVDNFAIDIILRQMVFWNVLLFLFNLIPLFPLDGWYILLALLPPGPAEVWERNAQLTQYVFFGALLLSFTGIFDVFGLFILQPLNFIMNVLGM